VSTATDQRTLDKLCVDTIRTLSMDGVQKANSGHPGTPMALAPLTYVLYTRVMRHNPEDPNWFNRDRFVLSAGHASMLLYSMLYLTGYGLTLDDLKNFRQLGSPTAGHPEYEYDHAPGIEATTGPLGQGISNAAGMALAERMWAARLNKPGHDVVDHYTYTIASDGDIEEGISSETGSLAGHLGLGRLIAFYDQNHISIEGDTDLALSEDTGKRYEAYGWHVQNLGEDMELDSIENAIAKAKEVEDRPSLIIVRSHIAFGSPNKQDTAGAHGSPLGEEEVKLTKQQYGWPSEEPFFVPDEALEHFRSTIQRGKDEEAKWQERVERWGSEHPDLKAWMDRILEHKLPDGWDSDVPVFSADDDPIATRKASNKVIQWAAKQVPELVGGSADLAPSTLTLIDGADAIAKRQYSGRNLHFGIREHGMGAMVNGLVLSGFRAYGSTFLIFSDYMKGSLRLSAVMQIPSIWVFTHDSIGLGEDGPTHQPIEQLVHLRAVPNLYVVRPADANETALAWAFALRQTDRPTLFALSRQGLPIQDRAKVPDDAIERGAYVLHEAAAEPDCIIIATGSEVYLAVEAAELLDGDGIKANVVSMPCMDAFEEQDDAYKESVLPRAVRARVSVEAASVMGWDRYVGPDGEIVGMTTFGASGPQKALYEHFGFTPENIAEHARTSVKRVSG
jgi:transketolase